MEAGAELEDRGDRTVHVEGTGQNIFENNVVVQVIAADAARGRRETGYQGMGGRFELSRLFDAGACKRKRIKLASGQLLDLCDVAYQYPQRVFKYGLQYKTFYDRMVFW